MRLLYEREIMGKPLVKTIDLFKYYSKESGFIRKLLRQSDSIKAVNGVSLNIFGGETLGLVGESGCGKSTLGRTIIKLEEATKGFVEFDGVNLNQVVKKSEIKKLRKQMQIVFQNPSGTLDPKMKVGEIVSQPLRIHFKLTNKERHQRVGELLSMVGLDWNFAGRYPGELSDGQKQRIAIIRAISVNPKFIVADEPVSALDISVQAQVLNLMKSLKQKMGLATLFISHDLQVVAFMSDRIAVIYLGKVVELGPSDEFFAKPRHPYSKALQASALDLSPGIDLNKMKLKYEDVPSQTELPPGCVFHLKCPEARKNCKETEPQLKEVTKGHYVACFYA